jgi:hypothetical protein
VKATSIVYSIILHYYDTDICESMQEERSIVASNETAAVAKAVRLSDIRIDYPISGATIERVTGKRAHTEPKYITLL